MSAACWADPLSRAERRVVAAALASACKRFWYAGELRRGLLRGTTYAQMSLEMSDLHLDVTERAEVATS